MVFGKKKNDSVFYVEPTNDRVSSVIGSGINWQGDLRGTGGVRIEGTVEGEIAIQGLVVIGETGRVTCKQLEAETVIVAGVYKGNILCQKLEIRSTGRVWGDVVTSSFASEDGAFFRGQMRMEEKVELNFTPPPVATDMPADEVEAKPEN
jgi:cytoskeletal protein CcmA (bactofilin family)